MSISLQDIQFLTTMYGERLLARLADEDLSDANTLRLLTVLRRDYTAQQAGAALEMARLRVKAAEKFGTDARRMFFTREALEQASDPLVRRYRANEIGNLDVERLVDAGCGIGADSLALARVGAAVVGLDIDSVRIEIARYNAAALESAAKFEIADIREEMPEADVVFFDPARRDAHGKRIYDVERYEPPLSIVQGWSHTVIVVKLSPGVDLEQLKGFRGEVEFISVDGDLKEAVLWLGEGYSGRRATLLVGTEVFHWDGRGSQLTNPHSELSAPRGWLVEPDPAILRAGLVEDAAAELNGFLLDETIAYFTTETKPDSPWVRAWEIFDWMPFNQKRLRAYLREQDVGSVTVKKRGSPLTPETLIPQLKLKGDATRTLVLTRYRGQPIVLICGANPG